MGRDNQPKHRQVARSLKRREGKRQTYERILIVCEGQKTEPNYLRDIQQHYRLSTTHVQVLHSAHGTEPQQVLEHALSVFNKGDRDRGIFPRAFDRIVVVFDRDEHKTYHLTLDQAEQVSGRLKNDAPSRAAQLESEHTARDGSKPFTGMHRLVGRLVHLKD